VRVLLKDELGVTKYNGVIRNLTGSSQIAVSAHAQQNTAKKSQNVVKSLKISLPSLF